MAVFYANGNPANPSDPAVALSIQHGEAVPQGADYILPESSWAYRAAVAAVTGAQLPPPTFAAPRPTAPLQQGTQPRPTSPQAPLSSPATSLGFGPSSDPALAQFNAQGGQLAARAAGLQAGQQVQAAQAGLVGPQQAVIQASQGVLAARAAQLPQQQALSGLELQNAQANQSENTAYRTALLDTQNIADTAAQRRVAGSLDYRYGMAGLEQPEQVIAPEGQQIENVPGVRAAVLSKAERIAYNNKFSQSGRADVIATAKAALEQTNDSVRAAQLVSEQAGISLEQARQAVDLARLSSLYADLQFKSASLQEDAASRPPAPGMVQYSDPQTGASRWVTAQEKATLDAQDKQRLGSVIDQAVYGTDPAGQLAAGGEGFVRTWFMEQTDPNAVYTAYAALQKLGNSDFLAHQKVETWEAQRKQGAQGYGDDQVGQIAALGQGYITQAVGDGSLTRDLAYAALIRRGLTDYQANQVINTALATRRTTPTGGGTLADFLNNSGTAPPPPPPQVYPGDLGVWQW